MSHIAFAPGAQPQTFLVTPQFIGQRAERELADGGGYFITLGLSKADKKRLGCNIIELVRTEDDPTIELHQRLELTITGRRAENYRARPFVALQADGALVCARTSLALSREMGRIRPIDPPVHLRLGDGRACPLAA